MIKGRRGGFTDLFIFMIVAIIIVFVSGMFIYLSGEVNTQLHLTMDSMTFGSVNGSDIVTNTMGHVSSTYDALYWISVFLIVGMIIAIFMGSYLVTTKPVFFIPYLFVVTIAVVVSVGLSNAYEQVIHTPSLASTFNKFVGANFILSKLPIWITIIGFVGGIIMFIRMGSKENDLYGGYAG